MFIDSRYVGRVATHLIGYTGVLESVDGEFANVRFWFGRTRVRTEDLMLWPKWKELAHRLVVKPLEKTIMQVAGFFVCVICFFLDQ